MKKHRFKQLLMAIFLISSINVNSMDWAQPNNPIIFINSEEANTPPIIHPNRYITEPDGWVTYGHYMNTESHHLQKIPYPRQLKKIVSNITTVQAYSAMMYNRNNTLLALPHEISQLIMPEPCINTTVPLKDAIRTSLLLKTTCKHFNTIFTPEIIGKACKNYSKKEKNEALEKLLWKMNNANYWSSKRQAALILVHAGADNDARKYNSLLETATSMNDKDMIISLFKNNANPNQTSALGPIFFFIKTVKIAEIFIANGLNVHAKEDVTYLNVLWKNVGYNDPHELVELFVKYNVNTKKIDPYDNQCLLHHLFLDIPISNHTNFLEIAKILLKAAPDMINTLDKNHETPLDRALAEIKSYSNPIFSKERTLLENLIKLFKEHGAKTAQKLKQDTLDAQPKNIEVSHQDCCICLDVNENMIEIPCSNSHSEKFCSPCYEKSLKYSDKCPLCRNTLS